MREGRSARRLAKRERPLLPAAWLAIFVSISAGCATGAAGPGTWPREVTNPVAYTEEMAEVARTVAGGGTDKERLHRLQGFLFDPERFPFEYEATGTYVAEETFRLRRGNCVSFTALFVALGRAVGIPLYAALIEGGEAEREGPIVVVNNHMVAALPSPKGIAVYDFARERDAPISGLTLIDDLGLAAVYFNNWGTEKLRSGRIGAAASDLELAIHLAPGLVAPYGNLGVARRMAGDTEGALDVYRRALEVDAANPMILNNLATLYHSLGREEEAAAALRAADLTGATPFVLIARGDLERAQAHYRKALRLYHRAHRAAPDLAEPWVAVARLEMARERPKAARKALGRALERDPENSAAQRLERRLADRHPPGAQSLGSTGSLSRARTAKTHSWTRRRGSPSTKRWSPSRPRASSRKASDRFRPSDRWRSRSRFAGSVYSGP